MRVVKTASLFWTPYLKQGLLFPFPGKLPGLDYQRTWGSDHTLARWSELPLFEQSGSILTYLRLKQLTTALIQESVHSYPMWVSLKARGSINRNTFTCLFSTSFRRPIWRDNLYKDSSRNQLCIQKPERFPWKHYFQYALAPCKTSDKGAGEKTFLANPTGLEISGRFYRRGDSWSSEVNEPLWNRVEKEKGSLTDFRNPKLLIVAAALR